MFQEQRSEAYREGDSGRIVRGRERRLEDSAQRIPIISLAINSFEGSDRVFVNGVQVERTSPIRFGTVLLGEIFFLQACEFA